MKRIVYFISIAVLTVSCLGNSPSTTRNYTLDVNFEYNDSIFATDSVRFESQGGVSIGYMDMAFHHKLNSEKNMLLGGFAVSRLKGSGSFQGRNDFRVNSGAGYGGSPTYAVFKYDKTGIYMPEHDIQFINAAYGTCNPLGFYVNNTYEVVDAVKASFERGDRLTLKATGYLKGTKTGEAEIALADYSAQKDSIVVNWTPFDLDKLGSVEYIELEVISTKPAVPTNVCIDNVVSRISIEY